MQMKPFISDLPLGTCTGPLVQYETLRMMHWHTCAHSQLHVDTARNRNCIYTAAPSPNTTKQQLSSAASSTQRMLHFGAPGSFVSAKQAGKPHMKML